MMSIIATKKVNITGHVQGVWFRTNAQEKAVELGIKGWIRNERDGSLTLIIQGETLFLERMIAWCHEGPPHAEVKNLTVIELPDAELYDEFEVRN